jgi:hypothetical protein
MDSKTVQSAGRGAEEDRSLASSESASAAFAEVRQDADEGAVQPLFGGHSPESASGAFAEVTQEADQGAVQPLMQSGAESPLPALSGTGFTYRHDWGRRRGAQTLRLNWGAVNPRSRVYVSIGEGVAGGLDNGKFIGSARYTVHNVAPRAGGVDVWVNIEWGSDISLYVDYLVVNP